MANDWANRAHRGAYDRGFAAFQQGRSHKSCPYSGAIARGGDRPFRNAWLAGWCDAKRSHEAALREARNG